MRERLKVLEEQHKQLKNIEKVLDSDLPAEEGPDYFKDRDVRSIYVSNVVCTPEELKQFFSDAGSVKTVTILEDKKTHQKKGFVFYSFFVNFQFF